MIDILVKESLFILPVSGISVLILDLTLMEEVVGEEADEVDEEVDKISPKIDKNQTFDYT